MPKLTYLQSPGVKLSKPGAAPAEAEPKAPCCAT
jgi:hypothetical protein